MIESLLAHGIWVAILFIIAGFVALVKGADCLVDGASSIAKRFGISDLVIGLTVVAFGTSMPEFVVNMVSVGEGSTELAITNILGSNIINTLVILGLTAVIFPIASQKHSRNFDIPMSILAGVQVAERCSPCATPGASVQRFTIATKRLWPWPANDQYCRQHLTCNARISMN